MSRPNQFRRAAVGLKSGTGQPAMPTIGNRSLHHYWALLKTHFRGVLLAPQSLSEGASTQWTWREPVDGPPLTTAELATVRKRLTGAQRSLVDAAEDTPESAAANPRRTGSVLPQLQAHMETVVTALTGLPDATLAAYVVRSEQGLLLHSWGLPTALIPHFPDDIHCEIAGTVFGAGMPAPEREVLLENPGGAPLHRTRSDAAGRFRFSKIPPGRYRARVVSDHDAFSAEGVMVEIDRASVTGLELRDRGDDQTLAAPEAPSRRRRMLAIILLGSLAIVGACVGWWRSAESLSPVTAANSSAKPNVASATIAPHPPERGEALPSPISSAAGAAPFRPKAKIESVEPSPTRARKPKPPVLESKRSPEVVVEQRVSGLGTAASSAPAAAASLPSTTAASAGAAGNAGAVSSGTGTSVSVGSSPTAAASAGQASSGSPSESQNAAASSSTASANPRLPPAIPPPTPLTPPPIAASVPTPGAPPKNQSGPPQTSASTSANPASTKTETASTEISATANPNPDSPGDKSANPDLAISSADDQPPDDTSLSDLGTTTSSNVTSSDETESTPLRPDSRPSDYRADSISTVSVTHQSLRMRIRVAAWQPRLLQDIILPTGPTRVGDDDAIEALRERLFRERRAQIPGLFKQPVTRIGFAIELPADVPGSRSGHWRDTENSAATHATVVARHAEISWPRHPPPGAAGSLLADDGRELARITADDLGRLTLVAVAGVRAWSWIGIERPMADDSHSTATEWAGRLEWRVLSGAPAAPTWRRDDHWLKDRGHRLNFALSLGAGGPVNHTLALVDRVTGWAIVSDIELAQELPAVAVSLSH